MPGDGCMDSSKVKAVMGISRKISTDIMKYLQEKKGQSVDDLAKAMSLSSTHIQEIIDKKTILTVDNIYSYLKHQNQKFWEFAFEAIPMDHLSPKSRKKLQICKELSDHIKKNRKKY